MELDLQTINILRRSEYYLPDLQDLVEEATLDIELAFDDIDPDDTQALYTRAAQIVGDIHSGRF